ncbi:MAG TPA: gliding motility-associated C-terminal domain-containing protein [Bacteroidales bacterium]|nr:gliding motility-associated C-terminal domain-containing protein [Bacteroidales bacterium]
MKHRVILIYISLMLFANIALSQSIHFRCIQVNDSSDVLLFWNATNLPDTYQFKIYTALNINGTYQLLDSVDINQSTYTHIGAKANLAQNFYYLQAHPINGDKMLPVYTSDTSHNIQLVVDDQSTGVAFLSWNYPINFSLNDTFSIERNTDGFWDRISTTSLITFNDTITFCGKNTYYQIRYNNGHGCDYISNQAHDFFTDFIAPVTARLDTVSINTLTSKTEIGWERSPSQDTYGYIVYFFKDNIWVILDTLYGAENTFYRDEKNSATSCSQEYRIATLDTCLNASPLGVVHHTLFLSFTLDKCDSIITLRWNDYQNMPGGVDSFRIYASENNGDFKYIASVKGNVYEYNYKHVNVSNTFRLYVQAYNSSNQYTSTSNIVDAVFNRISGSGSVLMRYVTVEENKHLDIAAYVNDSILFTNLFLYKSLDSGKTFTYFDKQEKVAGKETYLFSDNKVNVNSHVYYYVFTLTDECDIEYVASDTANNIVLQESASDFQSNSMLWNAYEGFSNDLEAYDIYRRTQSQSQFSVVSSEATSTLDYSEFIFNLADEGKTFYYKVVAVCRNDMFKDESVSNILEIHKKDTLYIPNAFYPNSEFEENRIFKPVCVFVDVNSYEFYIYNRWGSKIFSTTDIHQGWDGRYKGKEVPQGVYTYYIQYKLNEYHTRVVRGTFVLLR